MNRILFSILTISLLTSAYYPQGLPAIGGSWTFRSKQCSANNFLRHRESTAIFDTIQNPHPKFIIDFYDKAPLTSGTFKVIQGKPGEADEVSIGIGVISGMGLTFYSTNGGNGKETINVIVADGKTKISGTGVELANQKDPKDSASLSFDITFMQ